MYKEFVESSLILLLTMLIIGSGVILGARGIDTIQNYNQEMQERMMYLPGDL